MTYVGHDDQRVIARNNGYTDLIRAGKWVIENVLDLPFRVDIDYRRAASCEDEPIPCDRVNAAVSYNGHIIVRNHPMAPAVIYGTNDKTLRAVAALYLATHEEPAGYDLDEDYFAAEQWKPRREGDLVYMGKNVVARHTPDGLVFEDNKRGRLVASCTWAHGVL